MASRRPEGEKSNAVTFLLTDIQGSTKLWQRDPQAALASFSRYGELVAAIVERHRGHLLSAQGEGDSSFAVFADAGDAARAALDLQTALQDERWTPGAEIKARIGIHTGHALMNEGNYVGAEVNRCGRIRSAAHGGQIVVSKRTRDEALRSGGDLTFVDLGEHRLKDLALPERLYQLASPTLQQSFPPLSTLDVVRHNLPKNTSSFIGRERERRELQEALKHRRLVTVVGPGGTGKTRLSVEVAAGLVEAFADGVWFTDLAVVADDTLVWHSVAAVRGVSEEADSPLLDAVVNELRGRNLLLILDNCEHVLGGAASTAKVLLERCDHISILSTSREPLGVAGEKVVTLGPLDLTKSTAQGTSGVADAVALFNARAADVDSGFVPQEHTVAVADICRSVDGLPLAIELAAGQTLALSAEEIAADLRDDVTALRRPTANTYERQGSVRDLIEWSYQLLTEDERDIFAALGVFSGYFQRHAAVAVVGGARGDATPSLLTSLVAKSLIAGTKESGGTRYRMLDTIRAFARAKLSERADQQEIRRRHFDVYADMALDAEEGMRGIGQSAWLEAIEENIADFRLALEWALGHGNVPEEALNMSVSLAGFWEVRGFFREGRTWLERCLARVTRDSPRRAEALVAEGRLALYLGELEHALSCFDEALLIARQSGDDFVLAWALHNRAPHMESEIAASAMKAESLEAARRSGRAWITLPALHSLGVSALQAGDIARARALWREGLEVARSLGARIPEILMLLGLAETAVERDTDEAEVLAGEALTLARDLKHHRGIAEASALLARVHRTRGELPEAIAALSALIEEARRGQSDEVSSFVGDAYFEYGLVQNLRGEAEEALNWLRKGLAGIRRSGDATRIAETLLLLGEVEAERGRLEEARAHLEEALSIVSKLGRSDLRERVRVAIGEVSAARHPAT